MQCPVCGEQLKVPYQDTIEGTLCEMHETCPKGCYESYFAYGSTELRIGDKEWTYSYRETNEEERKRLAEEQEVIGALKRKDK